ncbi:hypothetical protein [Agitococcus lubricus]|uniref:Uncharacterized protein n=1 Tax=Agitococcus lubricus TaxID=1077255 RepID=A0A2T5J3Y9_9GAMM|nr:hypothetical protein [Agitococcus lubricus]PTQ91330.1 hypothetical protein C8N29_101403 [Agitococcus lubricus]
MKTLTCTLWVLAVVGSSQAQAFVADVLMAKDLSAGVFNSIPVCYTADAPAQISINKQIAAGAVAAYPVVFTPLPVMGSVLDASTVNVPVNTTPFGTICDGSVPNAVAFRFEFNAPTGADLATAGYLAGDYGTDIVISIAAL